MTIEESIFTRLTTYVGFAALASTRVYPRRAPQNPVMPFVVYKRISTTYVSAMGVDRPDTNARFQFDCISNTFGGARALLEQVKQALQRYQSPANSLGEILTEDEGDLLTEDDDALGMESEDVDNNGIIDAFILNENDFDDEESELYTSQIDFRIHYTT